MNIKSLFTFILLSTQVFLFVAEASPSAKSRPSTKEYKLSQKPRFVARVPTFDIPITYNKKVRYWINVFQTRGRGWFKKHMAISHKFKPLLEKSFSKKNLPKDLSHIAMIESGFSPHATSQAKAVGVWQFMKPTANSYGLRTSWWIDERKHLKKSTIAAANYLGDLHKIFNSWYLTAAAYNMGETKLLKLIKKHKTRNFWILSNKPGFPKETREYIPKLIAVTIIMKSPKLYGFKDVRLRPEKYNEILVPGGLDLVIMAQRIGLKQNSITRINPELTLGFIPKNIKKYKINVPKGKIKQVANYINIHF